MQRFLNWLVADFDAFGPHVQNWVLMAGAIIVIAIVVAWQDLRTPRR